MATHRFKTHAQAAPETVWEILADHSGMAAWTPVRKVALEREGDPAPNGVGAIRRLAAVGPPIREEITAFEPGRRLAYRMLSGAPVRDYNAQVDIAPAGSGTDIDWSVSFIPRLPGVGFVVGRVITQLAKSLAKEAERRSQNSA